MPFRKPEIVIPSFEERQAKAFSILELSPPKAKALVAQLEEFLKDGLNKNSEEIGVQETFVDVLPSARLTATVAVLCIGERDVTACRVDLAGGRALVGSSVPVEYSAEGDGRPLSLLANDTTASILMNACVRALQLLIQRGDERTTNARLSVIISSELPLQMSDKRSAILLNFHELCPQANDDPIEGTDLTTLLNIGLERARVNAVAVGVCSWTVASLLTGEYERLPSETRCLLAATVDLDCSFALALPEDFSRQLELKSRVLEIDLSGYRGIRVGKSDDNYITHQLLPRSQHDFAIDFDFCDSDRMQFRRFERMVGGRFMGEMIRRLIVNVFQHKCPQSVWKVNSLTLEIVFKLLDANEEGCAAICKELWNWDLSSSQSRQLILRCVEVVVRRSSDVVACALAVLARKTGRLQPALGGCSLALQGRLGSHAKYQKFMREGLNKLFEKDTANLIKFISVEDAPSKGAAILGVLMQDS